MKSQLYHYCSSDIQEDLKNIIECSANLSSVISLSRIFTTDANDVPTIQVNLVLIKVFADYKRVDLK